jgi:hypothetical protein
MAAAFLVMGDNRYVNLDYVQLDFFKIIIHSDVGRRKCNVLV